MQWIQRILTYVRDRYGYDELSKFLLIVGLIFGIVSNFFEGSLFSILGIAIIAFGGLRILSTEKENRLKELRLYTKTKRSVTTRYQKIKNKWAQRKAYKIVKCPECKQKLRVPRKKEKIRITCSKCQHRFVKKT